MPLFEIREERLYYVRARTKDAAVGVYGNAHATEAASAKVIKVRRIRNGDIDTADVLGEIEHDL